MKKKLIVAWMALVLFSGCTNIPQQNTSVTAPVVEPSPVVQPQTPTSTPNETDNTPLYNFNGKTFVNLTTEAREKFVPADLELVSWQAGINLPDYLIFKKQNSLFRYSAKTHAVDPVKVRAVASDERVTVTPSLSDKSQFLINFSKGRPVDGMYDFEIDSTTRYYYDAAKNTASEATGLAKVKEDYGTCHEYDSQHQRMFIWKCGEGVGSVGPIESFDIATGKTSPFISNKDFGLSEDQSFTINSNNGRLMLEIGNFMANENTQKFIDVDISEQNPELTTITVTPEIVQKILTTSKYGGANPYSILYIKEKNLLAIGFGDGVSLIKLNDQHETTDMVNFADDGSYINFMNVNGNKLYYKNGKSDIQVLNLDSLTLEKTIARQETDGQEDGIGLIR